jgi:hypothetical protein
MYIYMCTFLYIRTTHLCINTQERRITSKFFIHIMTISIHYFHFVGSFEECWHYDLGLFSHIFDLRREKSSEVPPFVYFGLKLLPLALFDVSLVYRDYKIIGYSEWASTIGVQDSEFTSCFRFCDIFEVVFWQRLCLSLLMALNSLYCSMQMEHYNWLIFAIDWSIRRYYDLQSYN